ncbi:dinitrogenase iron-molybdenum cofactor biosynthesis protein [Acidaminobacter sp. JC074]|uniref:NifB/NifX family molybdenum-iron cluster-binding protein n=1 Tax=Acidaminobacter sp. JC074 TaxID=2530199 RepID=UPI001F114ABC|nr:NifB/NifX family molybdenum-iron cluster-binding protein [Acidaminobacter sp. JC074]MCH4891027.1 dinitrogenase iron-molybdenum cofactor biosynthesis protein [Acidaminobacter sp. JC074]
MKIALPTSNNSVDGHFGHCEYFTVYKVNTDTKLIIEESRIEAPKGCGCRSNIASVLASENVKVLLTNNLGGNALSKLTKESIEVIRGCSGSVEEVAKAWLKGQVKDSIFPCIDHE